MSSSWEKYFKPSYNRHQETNEPIKEFLFFGGICFFLTLLILNLNKFQLIPNNLNIPFSTKPELVQKLEILEAKNSILESQILILNHKASLSLEKKAENYINKFNSLLAIKEYKGEGVIIKLNDSTKPLTFSENPNLMVIHNLDLLSIVNELWGSGAKAISVNDQRIIETSGFNCIGPILLINSSRVLPPFTIKAIGNADKLYNTATNGYIKKYDLKNYGITYNIEKRSNITVPASNKTLFTSLKGNL